MGLVDHICVGLFAIALCLGTLPAYFLSRAGLWWVSCSPKGKAQGRLKALNRRVILLTRFGWRATLAVCCWIRVHVEGVDELRSKPETPGRPRIFIANHTSFMDTIMVITTMPSSQLCKLKILASAKVFKMPLIGKIIKAMGHLPVPFKTDDVDSTNMDVDKAGMSECQQKLEDWVRLEGGGGGWFPEGRLNPGDTHKVGLFRAGGMAMAARLDLEIWGLAFCGNTVTWPRKAALGGRPARIGAKVFCVCESTHEVLRAAGLMDGSDERTQAVCLANFAQQKVQENLDKLVEQGYVGARRPKANSKRVQVQPAPEPVGNATGKEDPL